MIRRFGKAGKGPGEFKLGHEINRFPGISRPADKTRLPQEYVRKLKIYCQTDPDWRNCWNYLKDYLAFPDYFAAGRDFFIDGDLLYVRTCRLKNDQIQWLVFDLKGAFRGHARLPVIGFDIDQPPPRHGVF